MPSTRPYLPRIGLVFDFDKTLASDSVDSITAVLGLERSEWEQRYKAPLGQGWNDILLRGQALIRAGRDVGRPLTPAVLREAAQRIELYPALYLRAYAEGLDLKTANGRHRARARHARPSRPDDPRRDGDSDLEAFGHLENAGGLAIATEDRARFDSAEQQSADQRVENLAPSDDREGSELLTSLSPAVRACAAKVALRARGRGQ